MRKTVICNIPMSNNIEKIMYATTDVSLPVSQRVVTYPVIALLEETLDSSDVVKVILLTKKDENNFYRKNTSTFIEELQCANEKIGAQIEYKIIETEFNEDQRVHEKLLLDITDEIVEGTHIIADITYGPKDLPVVLFSALNFAEKFLSCEIDNIVYGQASFVDNKVVGKKICDMVPLYYLNSVTNTIRCDEPKKARALLKTLLTV